MSDNISDIDSVYQRNGISSGCPHTFGLFSIPEYPEYEARGGMWSTALDVILTTLRYLAPATLITLFWGQPSFLFRILKHIDLAVRGIVVSSDEQTQSILRWLSDASTVKVDDLDTLWRQGWLLCGILDSTLPGACAGHPPNRLSLLHAQTIADHYLGVDPVFTRQELESQDSLSRNQEWKLAQYLERVREALAKVPLPVSRPPSQRNTPEISHTNLDYIAQGSGLTAAQVNQKIYFKVYPTSNQCLEPGELNVLIKGPRDTYGMKVIAPILGKAQQIRQKLLNLRPNTHYTENVLPITQGTTYLRSYGKNVMNKTYHIPKTIYDIDIEEEITDEFVKVGYIVNSPGKYEINVTTRGQHIGGSPFRVTATNNIIGVLAEDISKLENGEEIDILDANTDRKVVLRIVDFVTEKMLLNENGSFEKISEDEAKMLMSTDNVIQNRQNEIAGKKMKKFFQAAHQMVLIIRTCKIFMHFLKESKVKIQIMDNAESNVPRHSLGIPDVVNSTLYDNKSMRTSIVVSNSNIRENNNLTKTNELDHVPINLNKTSRIMETTDVIFSDRELNESSINKQMSPGNPFLEDINTIQTNIVVENETDHQKELKNIPPIFIEEDNESISPVTNPFYDPEIIERPKTPVLKIITGEVEGREDSVYFDPDMEKLAEKIMGNEFINPFFMHQHNSIPSGTGVKTDFLIGAPVSSPPGMRASTPEPDMESLFVTSNDDLLYAETNINEIGQVSSSFLTNVDNASMDSSTFRSIDSNVTDTVEDFFPKDSERNLDQIEIEVIVPDIRPRKELWDSAYVSIDDANSSPDSNESSSACETPIKDKVKDANLTKMGPAEKELWVTCMELSNSIPRLNNEIRSYKWDVKRPTFTPIIEENDRSLSTGLKESELVISSRNDEDPISVAFAELKDVFQEYASNSEDSSISNVETIAQNKDLEQSLQDYGNTVKSASENVSDTTRLVKHEKETTSEVQANFTEFTSVSQILQDHSIDKPKYDVTHFGKKYSTIVREKKKYWDDRIRNMEENKIQETKSKKPMNKINRNNGSLTKRRGKQMVKNFLAAGEINAESKINKEIDTFSKSILTVESDIAMSLDNTNFADKWKRFWNDKQENAEIKHKDTKSSGCYHIRSKYPKANGMSHESSGIQITNITSLDKSELSNGTPKELSNSSHNTSDISDKTDLSEEVFKAFETSPKRFFGRSRKQILNKIDAFIGQTTNGESPEEVPMKKEKGIVSSRISLFHSISTHVEDHRKNNMNRSSIPDNNNKEVNLSRTNGDLSATFSSVDKIISNTKNIPDFEETINVDVLTDKKITFNNMKNKLSAELAKTKVMGYGNQTSVIEINKLTPVHKRITRQKNDSNGSENQNSTLETLSKPLKKSCVSKSEMDIYTRVTEVTPETVFDKHKSYEELPRTNVKHVITMYESVSRSVETKPKPISRQRAISGTEKEMTQNYTFLERADTAVSPTPIVNKNIPDIQSDVPTPPPRNKRWNKILNKEEIRSSIESLDELKKPNFTCDDTLRINERAKSEEKYISLSDIDLEIIENPQDQVAEMIKSTEPTDYQSRFKMAKQFFQSLEELRPEIKKPKQNECELLLQSSKSESLEKAIPKKVKKLRKSNSMPSSELSKLWQDYQEREKELNKPVKISEKFNIDGLFSDVTEGKLSRQGSLRGIPHKKAVLETFKSMENVNNTKLSPYELAVSQLSEFAKANNIKNSQTYLTEYPYLPTTDPSKYHSRLDTKASGLISMKELLSKPRRNSFPDLRLSPKFSEEL